ncbi:hypothetical protein RISK_002317 [Rhodopirellula islandica]|uniref:Uncharacterized protein n=2 Tax=Rhodopirellula islandica TaxID=595434 RepID=A0A0J1BGL9_RHOIS|nr:hypothetical protein RISK_002317 [Rhodopirellula islandica]
MNSSMNASNQNDEMETPPVVVVVLDHNACRVGTAVPYDAALTLWATMSEDPANWNEVAEYWGRYRSPTVCEFVDGLPIQTSDPQEAFAAIDGHENWLAIDLIQKRIIVGDSVQKLGARATLALETDLEGQKCCPLPFVLPPWWELHESASASLVLDQRESEISIPRTNRSFLFGTPLIETFAEQILKAVSAGRYPPKNLEEQEAWNARHALTVEVHASWLMTPREEVSGRCPRSLMHGAHDWSDAVIWGQRQRFENGMPMIATPDDVLGYDDAPMGTEEMIMYFDLCRHLLDAGWDWCDLQHELSGETQTEMKQKDQLSAFLSDARDSWMDQPFEGGSPTRFIMECSRRRVPRGSEVPIVGMDDTECEQHMPDCDCPICDMMASGLFGVGFTSLAGDSLESDNEFAFSMHETIEDWQREQDEFREFNEKMEREFAERKAMAATGENQDDVFASAWSSPMSEEALPGDASGFLKLSFRLAEIISDLENADTAKEIIQQLNRSFREYRECKDGEHATAKHTLRERLDEVAARHPELVPKVADFHAQIDEQARARASNTD